MSFFAKPLNEVGQEDLETLVQEEVRERQTLEFKRDSYARTDDGTREMLRDISAMANAYGGDILLGVETVGDGVASGLVSIPDGEREGQRIISSCLSNIEDRIGGLAAWPVPLSNGKHVIVIRMPQSLRAPHMVTFKGRTEFWVRHDRQKSPMSVHEVREACLRVEMLTTRVENFLEKRLANVLAFVRGRSTLTVSLTPLLVRASPIDTRDKRLREIIRDSSLGNGRMPTPCITGLQIKRVEGEWLRLDRNGHLDFWKDLTTEITEADFSGGRFRSLPGGAVKHYVAGLCDLGKKVYERYSVVQPLVARLDLWNITGVILRGKPAQAGSLGPAHDWPSNDPINLEPVEVDSLLDPERAVKVLLDRLWEAFGFDEAPF